MLPKLISIILASAIIILCSCSAPKNQESEKTATLENTANNMKGQIKAKTFVNKGGKEISTIKDLYFETGGDTYFIKFMDSKITYEEAEQLIDQTIEIEGEIREGLWDVPDDNPEYAQSRTGFYIVIFSIK